MLYGFNPNFKTTVVTADQTTADFQAWYKSLGGELYVTSYESDMMMHMTDPNLQGLKTAVFIFEFDHDFNQAEFARIHDITILKQAQAIDRNVDMYLHEQPDPYDAADTRTIEQIYELDKEDRYDTRDDEEKAEDAAFREQIKEMKKNNQLSGESFTPKGKDRVNVTQINTSVDANGHVTIENVQAVKHVPGEHNESIAQREKLEAKVAEENQLKAEKAIADKAADLAAAVEKTKVLATGKSKPAKK